MTGGSGAIGLATARALGHLGAAVLLIDIDSDANARAEAALRQEGVAVAVRNADVADLPSFLDAAQAAESRFGGIDILVNVAGSGTQTTLDATSAEAWDRIIRLNLSGPFNGIKACTDAMRRRGGGAIVTVSSLAAISMSMNFGASYTASKSGVLGLTRHAAFELARDNIRVNAVLPGPVLTQLTQRGTPQTQDEVIGRVPLGRWITPEEVAAPILFFCTDASSAITGTSLVVDGGLSIGCPTSPDVYFASRDQQPA